MIISIEECMVIIILQFSIDYKGLIIQREYMNENDAALLVAFEICSIMTCCHQIGVIQTNLYTTGRRFVVNISQNIVLESCFVQLKNN